MGAGHGVRPARGDAHDREALDAERVGDLLEVGGEVQQRAVRVRVRAAEPGPLREQHPQAERVDRERELAAALQRRADRAVQVDHGLHRRAGRRR